MLLLTKVLIHDDRPDIPEFLLEIIVNRGYKAGFAKDGTEIIDMLSNDQYDIVLTNGGYRKLKGDQTPSLSLRGNVRSNENAGLDRIWTLRDLPDIFKKITIILK